MQNLACYIDHTLLKADATADDIKQLCDEAQKYEFLSVCVNSSRIGLAYNELEDSDVRVASVVGFLSERAIPTPNVTKQRWR